MRISLIGPGNIDLHYEKFLGLSKSEFLSELEQIAQALVDSDVEIELLPDKGVSLELARLYKKKGGRKVIAVLPKSDKEFGIKHLQPHLNEQINGTPLFDETIDSGNWFKHDMTKTLFGNAVLYLGESPGTEIERNGGIYLQYLTSGFKDADIPAISLHPEIKAGKDYTFLIYTSFMKPKKLSPASEFYLNEYKIKFKYIQDPKQLKQELKSFKQN